MAFACRPPAAHAEDVRVVVNPSQTGQRVDQRFIGLSFEAEALPTIVRGAVHGNLVARLRALGPGVMRFGGSSLDLHTAFSTTGRGPGWAETTITPRDLARLGRFARRSAWSVLLGLNLGYPDTGAAAREAAVARRELGPALAGVEVGNEPNGLGLLGLRPITWGYDDYLRELRAYRRALATAAPGVALAGPDTTQDAVDWLDAYTVDERPTLLTPHFYAHHGCFGAAATVGELLGPALSAREAADIARYARLARSSGIPMRLGETNNVACGGQLGVSDTFGAALWALRYMVRIARAGIDGVNFHALLDRCTGYSPLCAATAADYEAGRLRAMPEWYALLLFRRIVGERFTRATVSGRPDGLTIAAFRGSHGRAVDVLAINSAPRTNVRLTLRVGRGSAIRAADVLRLTAPSRDATHGVRLRREARSARGAGTVRTTLRAASAVLVRLRL